MKRFLATKSFIIFASITVFIASTSLVALNDSPAPSREVTSCERPEIKKGGIMLWDLISHRIGSLVSI